MKQVFVVTLALVALCAGLNAQNRTRFGGQVTALDYAYGILPNTPGPLQVSTGNTTTTGTGTVTLVTSAVTLGDGRIVFPLATNAPITIDAGSNQETVTPSSLSNCGANLGLYTCQVSASFTKTHGTGSLITSGTVGLQEAIDSGGGPGGGGMVLIDSGWTSYGGTTAMIAAAAPFSNVSIKDNRATAINPYWTDQPTTLTSLAVPTTLTSTTAVFSGTGTWTAAAQHLCVTYVDALGGEGPCSLDYSVTPSASTSLTVTSPAASAGAVGWRAYSGASYNGAYLLPITAPNCTLTSLESVMPSCAIGSAGTWAAIFVNTTTFRPNAQTSPVVNLNLPYPQGHTTMGYQPSGSAPQSFQAHYGPFTAFGSTTSAQVDVLGSANLPTGLLNTIGRVVRVTGKVALTANTAAIPTVTLSLGWVGGTTAGAPVAVCTDVGAAYGASAAFNLIFECDFTTNSIGATGSIMPDGRMDYAAAAGADGVNTVDTSVAAVASLNLAAQDLLYVSYTSGTNTTSAVQLLDLHIEVLQ